MSCQLFPQMTLPALWDAFKVGNSLVYIHPILKTQTFSSMVRYRSCPPPIFFSQMKTRIKITPKPVSPAWLFRPDQVRSHKCTSSSSSTTMDSTPSQVSDCSSLLPPWFSAPPLTPASSLRPFCTLPVVPTQFLFNLNICSGNLWSGLDMECFFFIMMSSQS